MRAWRWSRSLSLAFFFYIAINRSAYLIRFKSLWYFSSVRNHYSVARMFTSYHRCQRPLSQRVFSSGHNDFPLFFVYSIQKRLSKQQKRLASHLPAYTLLFMHFLCIVRQTGVYHRCHLPFTKSLFAHCLSSFIFLLLYQHINNRENFYAYNGTIKCWNIIELYLENPN